MAVNPSFEEEIVKVLNVEKIDEKLELSVRTRSNI